MTVRLVPPPIEDAPEIRRSAKVATVARQLEEDPAQIRRMLKAGDLEGHRSGKRGVRVFLDSVEALQKNRAIQAQKGGQAAPPPGPKPLSRPAQAAHRQAVAHLQGLGFVRSKRQ